MKFIRTYEHYTDDPLTWNGSGKIPPATVYCIDNSLDPELVVGSQYKIHSSDGYPDPEVYISVGNKLIWGPYPARIFSINPKHPNIKAKQFDL